uniref:Uncharacterized protein n=1 Tax=Aegilops tauschii subsp. strangulata TaxID=200361 RepID=A0A453DBG0_AEGTS
MFWFRIKDGKILQYSFKNSILMNGYCACMGSIILYLHCFHIITLYSNNLVICVIVILCSILNWLLKYGSELY